MNQLNASVRTIFQDLVERRLWPVALVLVIALIAIPVLLSNSASETSSTPGAPATPIAPATGAGTLSAFQPVVSTEGSKSSEINKNLSGFDSKDPFKVQGLSTGGSTEPAGATGTAGVAGTPTGSTGTTGTTTGTGTTAGTGSGTSGSGTSTGSSGDSTGESGVKYYTWTATVRFGIGDDFEKKRLERFRALPSSENPVVVFMGAKTDGKTAVFLVSAASSTTGDGDCEPDDTCTFLYMKADQTQSFEAVDENNQVVTYKLKLIELQAEETEAPKSQSSTARAQRRAARKAARAQREGFASRIDAIGF